MDLEAKIDFKDLKKQKNKSKKQFKKAIKQKDYDMIQQCLTFIKKYDEMVKTEKYEKYYNSLPKDTKEIIRLRAEITMLKDIDLSVFEIFEKRLSDAITEHINKHCARELIKMKKQLTNVKKQVSLKQTKRVKAPTKVKQMNIT